MTPTTSSSAGEGNPAGSKDWSSGHNIFEFDLSFLWKRSVIHRVRPPVRRVHIRRFDHVTYATEEGARHAFMRLWREVELLESPAEIELAAD